MRTIALRLLALIAFVLLTGQAFADDWNVVRLRGSVLQLVDGAWQPLKRGAVVPDERVVLTRGNGYATLTRGNETIDLSPNTQIQIYDRGGRKPFTTVLQHFGTVAIEAEVRNVQHFAVKNAYLAAVVKGTRFVVKAGKSGASVEVQRGQVSVEDKQRSETTMVVAGQKATVEKGKSLNVSGKAKPAAAKTLLQLGAKLGMPDLVRAQRDAEKAAKDAEKAAKDAEKAAERAAKEAEKTARDEGKNTPKSDDHAGKGKSDDSPSDGKNGDNSGKGKNEDPGKGKNDDNPSEGKNRDNSGKGKNEDSGKGTEDNSGKGKNEDNSGKGKSEDSDKGKTEDNSGKGGNNDDKPKKGKG